MIRGACDLSVYTYCFIYRYYYPLYSSNDFSKVFLLSVAIGAPICLIMTVFNSLMFGNLKTKDQDIKIEWQLMLMGVTSGFCGFIFYAACLAHYLIPEISARDGIELMLYGFGGAIFYSVLHAVKAKRNKEKKNAK